jgi:hypothetical protein
LCEPFAGVAFRDVCLEGELCAGHRSGAVHSLVETKAYTNSHQRHTDRRAEIDHHLSEELLELLFVDHVASLLMTSEVPGQSCRALRITLSGGFGPQAAVRAPSQLPWNYAALMTTLPTGNASTALLHEQCEAQ